MFVVSEQDSNLNFVIANEVKQSKELLSKDCFVFPPRNDERRCHYENQKGKMGLEEIKEFLSVQASFASHAKHANSYNLMKKNRRNK